MRRMALLVALATLVIPINDLSGQVARRPFLFKDARGELAQARAQGQADVLLVIAAMPNRNAAAAAAVTDLGGTIQYRDDDVDYLRARVPVDGVERLAGHPAVHSVDVSITGLSRAFSMADGYEAADGPHQEGGEAGQPLSPRPDAELVEGAGPLAPVAGERVRSGVQLADTVWPPVLSDYPLTNRYSPHEDVRATSFLEANPTFDGRGVRVAMIDMNPDPLLPELQDATALDGSSVSKIVAFETALDMEEEDDGRWIRMTDVVEAPEGQLQYADTTYEAPGPGTYRVALYSEVRADSLSIYNGAGLERDVNRDGNPEGSSRDFLVAWNESTNDVWVDTDQDLSLADETALTDFRTRSEFGVFGTDDAETPIRESVAFSVQIAPEKKLVALNLGVARHASLVVGAAVASRGSEGRFDGMAPGAQLISVSEGGSAYGQTESTIISVKDHGADVVYFEQSSLITRSYLLRDGRLVPTVIYERLVDEYGPSILSPTHNYPILGGSDDFVVAKGVIGVGGHESKANFFQNHGVRVEHDDNLLITGGYGPMGNGALEPDIISPSNYVSTAQGFLEGAAIPGLFQLPPGYTIAGGTSTATPTAAGSVALLISGARQAGIAYDPYSIEYAVTRSARWVDHLPAYKQGNGVINVAGAWEILQQLDAGGQAVEIEVRAPVRHAYSHMLATPNEGVGLFERSGWKVGDVGEREITVTRTSGPSGSMTFTTSWAGNEEGTFTAPETIALPLNTPVPVSIGIAPESHGVHTAHLTLSHPDVPGFAHRMMATVVAPEPLSASSDYRLEKKAEIPRPGMTSFFIDVPEGVTTMQVGVTAPSRDVSLSVVRPDTRQQRGSFGGGRNVRQTVVAPMPGVWEIRLSDITDTRVFDWEQAKKDEPVPPTEATLTVTAHRTDVSLMGSDAVAEPDNGSHASVAGVHDLWIVNQLGEFTGGAVSTPMGNAREESVEISAGEQQVYEVDVPPGSMALGVRAYGWDDPDADLDVYVFNCAEEECRAAGTDADPEGFEGVLINEPAAGTWKIVVDAASVPSGTTTFEYMDVVLNPTYGAVSVVDVPQERASGARWMAKAHVWVAGAAEAEGRTFLPVVRIERENGELVGLQRLPIR